MAFRMEAEQSGAVSGIQFPVLATDGFVCVERQQSAAKLLLVDSRSAGMGQGTLSLNWDGWNAYAFPPIAMIQEVLRKVRSN